jgi:hypothetical protein
MKKALVLIISLLSLQVFASDTDCNNITDSAAKKECLAMQKQSEARNNFKNFEKNNKTPYPQSF